MRWSSPLARNVISIVATFLIWMYPKTSTAFLLPFISNQVTAPSSSFVALFSKATLTDETEWRLRFVLRNVVTENGKKVNEIFVVQGRFLEDDGYEPPQGRFVQTQKQKGGSSPLLRITSSRWQLSEDPNDRKDGLWVWGLFKEPLYPFLLLRLEIDTIPILGDDYIKPLQLYAQLNHKRDPTLGAVLSGATLNIRQKETIKADPFGASKVDLYEEVSVGNLSIQRIDTERESPLNYSVETSSMNNTTLDN